MNPDEWSEYPGVLAGDITAGAAELEARERAAAKAVRGMLHGPQKAPKPASTSWPLAEPPANIVTGNCNGPAWTVVVAPIPDGRGKR